MAPNPSIEFYFPPVFLQRVKFLFALLLVTGSLCAQTPRENLVTVKRVLPLMGCSFEITVIARSEEIGYINIEEAVAEIQRIENMISGSKEGSEVSKVNKQAGIAPVPVSREFFQLVQRAIKISEITSGAFDISFLPLNKVWHFDEPTSHFPTPEQVYGAQQLVGFRKIVLDEKNSSIYLTKKGMKLSFAGMGKGYAAERARDLLEARQVPGGIINAAGDITAWGAKVSGEQWIIGIENPGGKEGLFTWVPLYEGSVATANSYSKFIEFNGKKYSHILDPRSGYPVFGISKVAIFGRSAEFCDALATAIPVLGIEEGLKLINQLTGIEAIILDNTNTQHRSRGYPDLLLTD